MLRLRRPGSADKPLCLIARAPRHSEGLTEILTRSLYALTRCRSTTISLNVTGAPFTAPWFRRGRGILGGSGHWATCGGCARRWPRNAVRCREHGALAVPCDVSSAVLPRCRAMLRQGCSRSAVQRRKWGVLAVVARCLRMGSGRGARARLGRWKRQSQGKRPP